MRQLAGLVAALALAGCGLKLVDLGPAPDLYDLNPKAQFDQQMTAVSWQLVVDEPSTPSVLDTDRILVREGVNEVKYIAEARWAERTPRLVQSTLVEAFDQSGWIVGVGRTAIGLRGDYALQSELRAFDTVYGSGGPTVHIAITFKLVRQPYAKIIASKTFDESVHAGGSSMRSIATSYETALGQVLSGIVPWVLTEAERDYEQRIANRRPGAKEGDRPESAPNGPRASP